MVGGCASQSFGWGVEPKSVQLTGPMNYIKPYGVFLHCCGWWLMDEYSSLFAETSRAHAWWDNGQLDLLYGDSLPVALTHAVDAWGHGSHYAYKEKTKDAQSKNS
jgi:hypothetical protein